MSHITRGSRSDHRNYDDGNLFVSSSMQERERVDGNLFVSSSMKEDIGGTTDIESLREGSIIVDCIMDNLRLSNINIACDAALDQDVSQEIGFLGEEKMDFFNYEEQKDFLCPNCKDTGLVDSGIPMEGNEECYYCKDHDA